MLVSSNYDLPNLMKSLNGLVDTAYVLSHRSFGQKETEKLKALSMNLIGEEIDDVPQTYFFDHGTVQLVRDPQ